MENISFSDDSELDLDPFIIPMKGKYLVFLMGILVYLFSVSCNLTLMLLIVVQRNLHKPMYFILFSLPFNDLMGITTVLPKVLSDIVTETRKVHYHLCVLQAFLLHMYGGGILFVLAAMAFDRYVAICQPLRYNTIMTPRAVAVIILLVWGFDFVLFLSLFYMQVQLPRCRSTIMNVFCDNPSLLKLRCVDTSANNVLGLFITAIIQVITVSIQIFSYLKILIACVVTTKSGAKRKAVNTCIAQLLIFIVFEIVAIFTVLSHRFKDVSADLQKITGMLIFLVPPLFNPIVYGLNTKEIRNSLIRVFRSKVYNE